MVVQWRTKRVDLKKSTNISHSFWAWRSRWVGRLRIMWSSCRRGWEIWSRSMNTLRGRWILWNGWFKWGMPSNRRAVWRLSLYWVSLRPTVKGCLGWISMSLISWGVSWSIWRSWILNWMRIYFTLKSHQWKISKSPNIYCNSKLVKWRSRIISSGWDALCCRWRIPNSRGRSNWWPSTSSSCRRIWFDMSISCQRRKTRMTSR